MIKSVNGFADIKNLKLASDVHLEFGSDPVLWNRQFAPEESVLLIAGDLTSYPKFDRAEEYLEELQEDYAQILWIMGNHEYYHGNITHSDTVLAAAYQIEANLDNITVLENESFDFGNLVVHGCTMWTDFSKGNPLEMYRASQTMNDYRTCPGLTPELVLEKHLKSADWLKEAILSADDNAPCTQVIMTHHVPSERVIHPTFKDHLYNSAYRSTDLDWHIAEGASYGVKHWVFGHSHKSIEENLSDIQFTSNPYGYFQHEENLDFNEDKWLYV